jgi:hypothetical protein
VVIQNISNGLVNGFVRFNTGGNVAVKVHIIAIGIPN